MKPLSRITVCSCARRADLGAGTLKIGRDYACVSTTGNGEAILPDWDVRGHSVVASKDAIVRYAGEVVAVAVRNNPQSPGLTLRCRPATIFDG